MPRIPASQFMKSTQPIYALKGPNLNRLGKREPHIVEMIRGDPPGGNA